MTTRSALVVPFPETESVVGPLRQEYDSSAPLGVPAHVTLLTPFLPPGELDDTVLDRLRKMFRARDPFPVSFRRIRRFPDLIWLAPRPDKPLRAMTAQLCTTFPPLQPYGGRFTAEEATPHLTLGDHLDEIHMDEIEAALHDELPIRAVASEVWLMVGDDEGWELRHRFPLIG